MEILKQKEIELLKKRKKDCKENIKKSKILKFAEYPPKS